MLRIDREREKRGMEGGDVSIFVIAPDGKLLASMSVQRAYKPENLVPLLQKVVESQHLEIREAKDVKQTTAAARASFSSQNGGRLDAARLGAG